MISGSLARMASFLRHGCYCRIWLALLGASACAIDQREVQTVRAEVAGARAGAAIDPPLADAGIVPAPGPDSHVVSMADAGAVEAADAVALSVDFSGMGAGEVRIGPLDVVCRTKCVSRYSPGTEVTLIATPTQGSSFLGWSAGPCTGSGLCRVSLTSDTRVSAAFQRLPPIQLSVELDGQGRVTSTPLGLDCPGTCSAAFEAASTVVLHAGSLAGAAVYLAAWGGNCSGLGDCSLKLTQSLAVSARFAPANIAFVTSTTVNPGTLGSLARADELCQERASAGGLPGSYVAWLSTSNISARSRIARARGWVRPDGREVADSVEGLLSSEMFYPIRVDELGRDVSADGSDPLVTTGTGETGELGISNCTDWSDPNGEVEGGAASTLGPFFTRGTIVTCATPGRMYCFGVDRRVQVEPPPRAGRRAFVTAGTFVPAGGIGAADAICQAEAAAAGLRGNYLAKLASSNSPPAARFNLSGEPWVRPDGVLLADTAEQYFNAPFVLSSINMTAAGAYVSAEGVWYGLTFTGAFSSETTCRDWTSSALTTGISLNTGVTRNPESVAFGESCDLPLHLDCLQQ